jgi:hypothetical protein
MEILHEIDKIRIAINRQAGPTIFKCRACLCLAAFFNKDKEDGNNMAPDA